MNLNLRFAEYLKDLMSIDRHRFVSLDLHKNLLGDQGVKILMTEIRRSKSLVDLNLASNEISNEGMISIFDALQDNQSLSALNISTVDGVARIFFRLGNFPPSTTLSLVVCELGVFSFKGASSFFSLASGFREDLHCE